MKAGRSLPGHERHIPVEERAARPAVDRRDRWADAIARRLDGPMAILGLVLLGIVIVESFATVRGPVAAVLTTAGWVIWLLFVAEFGLRLAIAKSRVLFLKRNWWQVLFLLVPFLRALRLLRLFRLARAGRVVSSAVRTSRSAERTLTTRLGWAAAVHALVVITSAQLVVEFTPEDSALEALYLTARAAVSGEPLGIDGVVARVLDVFLATYAVVIFASLAGTLGAFFLHKKNTLPPADRSEGVDPPRHGM